ncbi:uncharacterized protein LOC111355065 [Spodoptera litura]|uniref:Uncharacterized protein LOC111355065 n=1 Tax=Spodoptera litura TaxID=69820 RepID=A0A9J7E9U2_SPOLT|nr:uncharacterized protein LOC111355065 [Spodoptera litura]
MPNKKTMSENELERRRIARREKYKQIKNDPEKYIAERAKKREAYLKRKESKKVKSINEMSPREQRVQRRKWRENSKRYYEKILKEKKIQEVIVPRTEIDSTAEDKTIDPLKRHDAERQYKSQNKILLNKIKVLKRKHLMEKKEMSCLIKKYQYRCRVLLRKINIMKNNHEKENVDSEKTGKIYAVTEDNTKSNTVCRKRNYDLYRKCLRSRLQKKILGGKSIQELVERFYEDDINSRNTAGKKQCVKKFGVTKQKRYLLDSVKKLHKKFMEENPNVKISYVTFARLRPFWVYLPRDDRDTCGCTVHTNMDIITSILKKKGIVDIINFQKMLDILCCDKYNLKCVSRTCQICKNKVIPYNEFSNHQKIEYYEWDRDKKKVGQKEITITKKFKRTTQIRNLILKLEDSLPKFFSHTANIINQYQIITELKKSLNDYEVLIHMDFSENYSYKFAEEVQSLHFGGSRGQISLHTVVIYIKKGRETINYSLCTVSECPRHDSPAVWAHLEKALEFVFEKSPNITTVHILTDSPSSQYRNKYIFYIMTQLRNVFSSLKSVTWNYQEAGHGKGAPDGVGAVVKRTADYQVKCGRDVGDFSTFVGIVRENVKNVEIRVVEEHEIREKEIHLPKNIAPFKGTMLVHQVLWNSDSEFLEFRKLSCYECVVTICKHDKHMQLHKIYKSPIDSEVGNVKIIPPNKKIKILSDITIKHSNKPCNTPTSRIHNEQNVTPLAKVKGTWENQSFMINQTGAMASGFGHQQEFLTFLNQQQVSKDLLND